MLGRLGDAFWLMLEGEHYHWLQQILRDRFPEKPIVIATLSNGQTHTYLPTRDSYGTGVYEDSVAIFAPGSLELLAEEITQRHRALAGRRLNESPVLGDASRHPFIGRPCVREKNFSRTSLLFGRK